MRWRIVTYYCPHVQREVTELWDGLFPCIPVNAYLREGSALRQWAPKTVELKAYRLLQFFRWLTDSGMSFWDPDVRLGGAVIVAFRNQLLDRVRPCDSTSEPSLTAQTASRIMGEVLDLCRFWRHRGERIRGDHRSTRKKDRSQRPAAFTVKAPNRSRRGRESLSPAEIDAIWDYLLTDCRPPRRCPSGESQERWRMRTALWARDCMVWTLFICTGLRHGEAPAIMLDDVRHDPDTGWWVHLIDPREVNVVDPRRRQIFQYGARLKTGGRDLIVWFQDRFGQVFTQWVQWRALLVAKAGRPDHGMLLVSAHGRKRSIGDPFTYDSGRALFDRLTAKVGPFEGDAGAGTFRLSPHRIRHTLESYLKALEVPLPIRQAVLGHRRPETTDLYGTVYRTALIRARNEFHRRFRDACDE